MTEHKPILKIEMTVKSHTINELSDKADNYAVGLKSDDVSFTVGLKEAKAKLSIKALDDILHFDFPVDGKYIIAIYPKTLTPIEPETPTQQTPLDNTNQAFADVPIDEEVEETKRVESAQKVD